jgi:hypothetical protein
VLAAFLAVGRRYDRVGALVVSTSTASGGSTTATATARGDRVLAAVASG